MALQPKAIRFVVRICGTRSAFRPISSTSSQDFRDPSRSNTESLLSMVDAPTGPSPPRSTSSSQPPRSAPMPSPFARNPRAGAQNDSSLRELAREAGRPRIESRPDELLEQVSKRRGMEKNLTKIWDQGEVYSPNDLSPGQMMRYRSYKRPMYDRFDMLGMNPLKEYKNFALLGEFMTDGGSIKPRRDTGLRPVNQRRLAKAVRRSIGLGLLPSTYKHPEVLDSESRKSESRFRQRYIN